MVRQAAGLHPPLVPLYSPPPPPMFRPPLHTADFSLGAVKAAQAAQVAQVAETPEDCVHPESESCLRKEAAEAARVAGVAAGATGSRPFEVEGHCRRKTPERSSCLPQAADLGPRPFEGLLFGGMLFPNLRGLR